MQNIRYRMWVHGLTFTRGVEVKHYINPARNPIDWGVFHTFAAKQTVHRQLKEDYLDEDWL
jgi:hypothetical protein